MKARIVLSIAFIFLFLHSFSQQQGENNCPLEKVVLGNTNPLRIVYQDKNRNNEYNPEMSSLGYDLIDMKIDTGKVYPIVRQIISPVFFAELNNKRWFIETKLSGFGKIESVSFAFYDDSGFCCKEFASLADRIRKEIVWKLFMNKDVEDLFYLQLTFPGPKL